MAAALVVWLVVRASGGTTAAKIFGWGALLSAIPACATLPGDRLLLIPGFGSFAVLALFLNRAGVEIPDQRAASDGVSPAQPPADPTTFLGKRILIVDDDVRNVFALTSALEQLGIDVVYAESGEAGLQVLDRDPSIDLVLMDVMMPGMDGLEATRRIRADGRFDRLPIIAITAKAMKDDQEQCLAAGANDYLAKPIDLSRLYSLLRVWMPTLERI